MKKNACVVLITGAISADAVTKFKADPRFSVVYEPDCSRQRIEELIGSARVLISRSETRIDAALIDLAPELKVIARAAVGVGNIAIEHASERGILVLNTPGKNTNSAAELSFGLLLAVVRNLPQAHHKVKAGGWDRHHYIGRELRGKKIGIVGLGHVGHRMAKFAQGFDLEVLAYDPYISPERFSRLNVTSCSSLLELARKVDILSIHTPLNAETRGMLDQKILAEMPSNAVLINAARGGIVDEKALLETLNRRSAFSAAIDTWEGEPKPHHELVTHPRVVCSPHIGASTHEAQKAIGESVYEQVVKAVVGGVVDHPVNLPQSTQGDHPLIKPYAVLAEKLGSLAGQLNLKNPHKIEVLYRGDLAEVDSSLIRLGWMKGFVACAVESFVSYVNAESLFRGLGLELSEACERDFEGYQSAIKFVLHYADGKTLSVGGIVFEAKYLRLSLIDGFYFEIEPHGDFLMIRNEDKPGVVGSVGQYLANEGINIDSFDLCRKSQGGQAMALAKVDGEIKASLLEKLGGLPYVESVSSFRL